MRGVVAWHQLTRDVAGKSGARLERLADKVHKPKAISDYKVVVALLNAWDANVKELAKLEGQEISALTKRTTLKNMVPAELQRDLEKDKSLKSYAEAWKYVLEQVPLRKKWGSKTSGKRGKDDMDGDAAEQDAADNPEGPCCASCDGSGGDELYTMKRQNSSFIGYCPY